MILKETNDKIIHEIGKSVCLLCNFEGQRRSVQYHVFYKVCKENKQETTILEGKKPHKCEYCHREFKCAAYLQDHNEKQHK